MAIGDTTIHCEEFPRCPDLIVVGSNPTFSLIMMLASAGADPCVLVGFTNIITCLRTLYIHLDITQVWNIGQAVYGYRQVLGIYFTWCIISVSRHRQAWDSPTMSRLRFQSLKHARQPNYRLFCFSCRCLCKPVKIVIDLCCVHTPNGTVFQVENVFTIVSDG